jgi:hypothetical protein
MQAHEKKTKQKGEEMGKPSKLRLQYIFKGNKQTQETTEKHMSPISDF